jgi:hypothetical protein
VSNQLRIAVMAVGLAALAACGGGDTDDAADATTTTRAPVTTAKRATTTAKPAATTTSAAPVKKSARCLDVDAALVEAISSGLKGGATLRAAQAVKSKDYSKVWMVSAELEGPALDGDDHVAVWATNALDGTGITMSVDGFAKEFSDWPDGSKTDAGTSQSDDGVAESKACVKATLGA